MVNLNKLHRALLRNSWGELLGAQLPHDLIKLSTTSVDLRNFIAKPKAWRRASFCAGASIVMAIASCVLSDHFKFENRLNYYNPTSYALWFIFSVGTLYQLPQLINKLQLCNQYPVLTLCASTILICGPLFLPAYNYAESTVAHPKSIASSLGLILSAGALYQMPAIICSLPMPEQLRATALCVGTASAAISSASYAMQFICSKYHISRDSRDFSLAFGVVAGAAIMRTL